MRRLGLPLALMLAFALAAPVAAESGSATYHGAITGASFTCHGEAVASPYDSVSGSWTLNLSNDKTATVTVHAWYDGAHHMSTGKGQYAVTADGGTVTGSLGIWTASLAGQATFAWRADLSAYYACPGAHAYDVLVYTGVVDD